MNPLSTDKPKDRKAHFKQVVVPHLKFAEASSAVIRQAEKVFLEGGEEPDEAFLKCLSWSWWLFLQPEQNEALWAQHFQRIRSRIGVDGAQNPVKYATMGKCIYAHWNINPSVAPLHNLGWSHAEDYAYFKFLLGEIYDPDNYYFLGEKTVFPVSSLSMVERVGWNIGSMMRGHYEAVDGKAPLLYPYWKQVILSIDPVAFEPESVFSRNADEVGAKMDVARVILQSLRPEYCKKKFLRKKNQKVIGGNDHPLSVQKMSADEFWNYSAFVSLREQFLTDIDNGVFPESIKRLKHWASRPETDPEGDAGKRWTRLLWSTEDDGIHLREYEDPWSITIKVRRSKAPKKSQLRLDTTEIAALRDAIEHYRTVLHQSHVPGFSEVFDNEEKLVAFAKHGARISTDKAIERLKNLYQYHTDKAFDEEILLLLVGHYVVDLANLEETEGGDLNRYYRECWKDFAKVIDHHSKISKVTTRRIKAAQSASNVDQLKLTIKGNAVHEFFYSLENRIDIEMGYYLPDAKLAEDMTVYIEKEKLPWKLHVVYKEGESGLTDDGDIVCYYLPEDCAAFFEA